MTSTPIIIITETSVFYVSLQESAGTQEMIQIKRLGNKLAFHESVVIEPDRQNPEFARKASSPISSQLPHPITNYPTDWRLGRKSLGIPHQKSMYMVLLPNALSSKQYDDIYESNIVYSHEYLLRLAVVVFFCLNLLICVRTVARASQMVSL